MKTIILALNGKMGVGKSEVIKTLTAYLADRESSNSLALVKFAAPLYDIQTLIYNRIGKEIPKAANGEAKDRRLLQWLGTDWGRETHGTSVWVDIWENDVKAHARAVASGGKIIVVSDDCRFENEAEKVKAVGGTVVKITSDRTGERIALQNTGHASEAGISNNCVDFVIENNGTLEDYKNQLTHLFDKLRLAE